MGREPVVLLSSDTDRLNEIKDYINGNLGKDLKIGILSGLFGKSNSQFRRLFKYQFKKSIGQYILEARMQMALKLLQERKHSVEGIARIVGYKNRTAFTHRFTSFYGKSPFEYLTGILCSDDK